MYRIAFLDTETLGSDINLDNFNELGIVTLYPFTENKDRVKRLQNIDVAITNKVVLDKEVLEQCSDLKLICVTATGTNNIDTFAAQERGVAVKNVRGYSSDSVAEHTFSMLLELLHRNAYYNDYVKSGRYAKHHLFTHIGHPITEIKGKTFGIIGLGAIGKRVGEIAEAFGAKVVFYSTSGSNSYYKYEKLGFEEFLSVSDIISIHAPYNEDTKNLIDAHAFKFVKPNCILINTGRGGIVVEEDLVTALIDDKIQAAALDVFENEPITDKSPLKQVIDPNKLLLTPHIAWASVEARIKLMELTFRNVKEFIESRKK